MAARIKADDSSKARSLVTGNESRAEQKPGQSHAPPCRQLIDLQIFARFSLCFRIFAAVVEVSKLQTRRMTKWNGIYGVYRLLLVSEG